MDRLYNVFAPKIKGLANATRNLANSTKELAQSINKPTTNDIVQITPRLYWMDYPSPNKIQKLANFLNTDFNNHYYIWNVGERSFPTEWFSHQVASHSHPGYPCHPFMELLMICKNILYFLASDPSNVAVVSCQESRGRSIMVISSLLSIMGAGHPGECLIKVCELTKTQDYQALFPSQHLYLSYVGNLIDGLKLNNSCLRLVSIVICGIPTITNCSAFRPYIQLFRNGKAIYNSLTETELKSYSQGDQSCIYDLKGIELSDDILVRCKHFENNETRIAMFRMMFNCSFMFDNVFRVWERDLDKSPQFKVDEGFFLDFIFERGTQKSFQTADQPQQYSQNTKNSNQLISQIMQECKGLVQKDKSITQDLTKNFILQSKSDEIFSIGSENEKEKDEIREQQNENKDKKRNNVNEIQQQQQQQQQQQNNLIKKENQLQEQQSSNKQIDKQQQQQQEQSQQQQIQEQKQEKELEQSDKYSQQQQQQQQQKQQIDNRLSEEHEQGEEQTEETIKQSEENKLVSQILEQLHNSDQEENEDDIDDYLNKLEQDQ